MYGVVGYSDVREALKKHKKIFDEWVKNGYEADMDWLVRMENDRFHPENKLPGVKSVIVLGAWYGGDSELADVANSANSPDSDEQIICSTKSGRVARYAAGRDYHKVLKKKLIELSDFLKNQEPDVQTYVSVDSGPTVDRVLAESAGLGFFGKNACIIDPRKGSYFFIASVFTNVELEVTASQHMPSCGDCRKCLQACPTGALVGPGQIDARKCISYLTIENKAGIPEEYRSAVGNRLFGCDICQEVCPFNVGRSHRQSVRIEKLKWNYGVGESLDLREVLSIRSDAEFLNRFAGTPLMRAKRRGLIRNACVVAGNSGDCGLIPYLQKVIEREDDDMLREHAKWGINRLENN